MNIRFEYLYRDYGNNKLGGSVVFRNKTHRNLKDLNMEIANVLGAEQSFIAEQAGIPPLSFDRYDRELDHIWHEFGSISLTADKATDNGDRDITELISSLGKAHIVV